VARAAKIAITVDREVLRRAEQLRRRTGESRSALLTRGLRRLLDDLEHRQNVDRYIAAYREHPESVAEVTPLDKLGVEALASLPWEDA
jgi:metal-responsive CopG/Arc/MetJ family transcriptional regulator